VKKEKRKGEQDEAVRAWLFVAALCLVAVACVLAFLL